MTTAEPESASLPGWPRLLSKSQAAAYIGLPMSQFERMIQSCSLPNSICVADSLLWDRHVLDAAISRINDQSSPAKRIPAPSFSCSTPHRTLGELIKAYMTGEKFQSLAPRTKSDYSSVFERLKAIESTSLDQITPGFLTRFKDELRAGQRAKVYVIQVLGAVFTWGRQRDWLATNPAHGRRDQA